MAHNKLRREIEKHKKDGGSTINPFTADTLLGRALAALGGPVAAERPPQVTVRTGEDIGVNDSAVVVGVVEDGVLVTSGEEGFFVTPPTVVDAAVLRNADPGDERESVLDVGGNVITGP